MRRSRCCKVVDNSTVSGMLSEFELNRWMRDEAIAQIDIDLSGGR